MRFSRGHTSGGWSPYALAEAGVFGLQGEFGVSGGMFAGCGAYRHFVTGVGLAADALHQWHTLEGDLEESRDLLGGVLNLSYIVSVKPGLYFNVSNGDPLLTIAIGTGL